MMPDPRLAMMAGFCVFAGAGVAVLLDLPAVASGLPAILVLLLLRRLAGCRSAPRSEAKGAKTKAVGSRLTRRHRPPWDPPTLDPLPTIDEERPEPTSPVEAEHQVAVEDEPADGIESDDEGLACVYEPVMDEASSISTWDKPGS